MATDKLTLKQEMFVKHYLSNGFNATQAAISAGYSEDSAGTNTAKLLKNTNISEAIEKAKEKLEKKFEVSTDEILQELHRIGFKESVDVDSVYRPQDKIKALELLGKYKALFTEKHSVEVTEKEKTMTGLAEDNAGSE